MNSQWPPRQESSLFHLARTAGGQLILDLFVQQLNSRYFSYALRRHHNTSIARLPHTTKKKKKNADLLALGPDLPPTVIHERGRDGALRRLRRCGAVPSSEMKDESHFCGRAVDITFPPSR